eukprot:12328993-Karenia_brevis.AAC.1
MQPLSSHLHDKTSPEKGQAMAGAASSRMRKLRTMTSTGRCSRAGWAPCIVGWQKFMGVGASSVWSLS